MAAHSRILVWRIPQTEEPGGLQSRGVAKSQTRLRTKGTMMFTLLWACPGPAWVLTAEVGSPVQNETTAPAGGSPACYGAESLHSREALPSKAALGISGPTLIIRLFSLWTS